MANRRQVINRIIDDISERGARPGDSLGTEKELGARYGVSARTMREAVVGLNFLGVLESRKKAGVFVGTPDVNRVLRMGIALLTNTEEGYRQLIDLRISLEVGTVYLLDKNNRDGWLERLRAIATEHTEKIAARATIELIHELDCAFHSTILKASGNPFLSEQHYIVADYFRRHAKDYEVNAPNWDELARSSLEHTQIVEALENKDLNLAALLLNAHLRRIRRASA